MSPPGRCRIRPPGNVTEADLVSPSTTSVLIVSRTASTAIAPISTLHLFAMATLTLVGLGASTSVHRARELGCRRCLAESSDSGLHGEQLGRLAVLWRISKRSPTRPTVGSPV